MTSRHRALILLILGPWALAHATFVMWSSSRDWDSPAAVAQAFLLPPLGLVVVFVAVALWLVDAAVRRRLPATTAPAMVGWHLGAALLAVLIGSLMTAGWYGMSVMLTWLIVSVYPIYLVLFSIVLGQRGALSEPA